MPQAIDAFIFYLFQYTVTNLNVFLILLAYGYVLNINNRSIFNSFYNLDTPKEIRSDNLSEQSYWLRKLNHIKSFNKIYWLRTVR